MKDLCASPERAPLTILIAALGGQGGGVLTDWIGQAARMQGLVVQATSTPGVSQRTGATTYYLEIACRAEPGAAEPVLGLMPLPGRVDVLVCSELLEAARMLERGMCTPSRTAVVASTHRVYTTREKMGGGDGRFDQARIVDAVRKLSRHCTLFDMDSVRSRHGAAISAALFGALAGSGALPLPRADCEDAIKNAGKGVTASLAAFAEAFDCAKKSHGDGSGSVVAAGPARDHPQAEALLDGTALKARIDLLPESVAEIVRPGAAQVAAYQDIAYAEKYVERVERIVRAERAGGGASPSEVARETARFLALWMCYDDVIRVASLKSRASRFARIRNEVRASDADVVRVYDYFKPGALEIAAVLPRRLGQWLERATLARAPSRRAGKGITLQSSSVSGALALRMAAGLRRLRPYSLRFGREQQAIAQWLALVEEALAAPGKEGIAAAADLARLPRLLKGYGETHSNGQEAFRRLLDAYRERGGARSPGAGEALRGMAQALLDTAGCGTPLSRQDVPGSGIRAQKVVWADRR